MKNSNTRIVKDFWETINARNWEKLREILHNEFLMTWPQSSEELNSQMFIDVNKHYPGNWSLNVETIVDGTSTVVSVVKVMIDLRIEVAISFFEIKENLVFRIIEYWPESFETPKWRSDLLNYF